MSIDNKNCGREPYDFYSTPEWCVHRLLEKVELPMGVWFEPTAGDGSIIKAVKSFTDASNTHVYTDVKWIANDIQSRFMTTLKELDCISVTCEDYLSLDCSNEKPAVIIGNPPYSSANLIIEKALKEAKIVVFLLRLNFLSSKKRCLWLQQNVPDVFVLPNRPSFKKTAKAKTDAAEYGWFIWNGKRKSSGKLSILALTPKDVRS